MKDSFYKIIDSEAKHMASNGGHQNSKMTAEERNQEL